MTCGCFARAALRVEPGYEVARNNLGILEPMTEEEFRERWRSGFFKKQNFVREA